MRLTDLGEMHDTDKLGHGYLPHYERHLGGPLTEPMRLVEIGVYRGGSLRMWRDYFRNADVHGIDIEAGFMLHGEERITTHQLDVGQVDATWPMLGVLDVVVDDGSHHPFDQMQAWRNLWPLLRPGGWYVIEDLAVMWREQWGGSPQFPNELAVKLSEWLLDVVRARIAELHVYDEIIFLRK